MGNKTLLISIKTIRQQEEVKPGTKLSRHLMAKLKHRVSKTN